MPWAETAAVLPFERADVHDREAAAVAVFPATEWSAHP